MQGWIKLHRNIMQSDTFSRLNATQQLIAIYIVLNANHQDGIWYDKYKDIEVEVKRGELVTSRSKIANDWFEGDKEVTEQKVRTTLKKLERFGFLTIESTKQYTLLKVHNYCVYQGDGKETNQAINQEETKKKPRNNQEETTNKNVKNDKNGKEEYSADFESFWNEYPNKKDKKRAFKSYKTAIKNNDPSVILAGTQGYRKAVKQAGTEEQFIKHGATFLNNDSFLDYLGGEKEPERNQEDVEAEQERERIEYLKGAVSLGEDYWKQENDPDMYWQAKEELKQIGQL